MAQGPTVTAWLSRDCAWAAADVVRRITNKSAGDVRIVSSWVSLDLSIVIRPAGRPLLRIYRDPFLTVFRRRYPLDCCVRPARPDADTRAKFSNSALLT